jgi:hypothetical protein
MFIDSAVLLDQVLVQVFDKVFHAALLSTFVNDCLIECADVVSSVFISLD